MMHRSYQQEDGHRGREAPRLSPASRAMLLLIAALPASARCHLLDLACGAGPLTHALATSLVPPPLSVVGIDRRMHPGVQTQTAHGMTYCEDDVRLLATQPTGSADLVTWQAGFATSDDPEAVAHAAARVLHPGGRLIVASTASWGRMDEHSTEEGGDRRSYPVPVRFWHHSPTRDLSLALSAGFVLEAVVPTGTPTQVLSLRKRLVARPLLKADANRERSMGSAADALRLSDQGPGWQGVRR